MVLRVPIRPSLLPSRWALGLLQLLYCRRLEDALQTRSSHPVLGTSQCPWCGGGQPDPWASLTPSEGPGGPCGKDRALFQHGRGWPPVRWVRPSCRAGRVQVQGRLPAWHVLLHRVLALALTLGWSADFRAVPASVWGHSGDSAGVEAVHTAGGCPAHAQGLPASCLLILSLAFTVWARVVTS